MLDRKSSVATIPETGLTVEAEAFVNLAIARAGISFAFSMFEFALEPIGSGTAKEGFEAATDVYFIMVHDRVESS